MARQPKMAICANPDCNRAGKLVPIRCVGLCRTCYKLYEQGRIHIPLITRTCLRPECGQTFQVHSAATQKIYCCTECKNLDETRRTKELAEQRKAGTIPVRAYTYNSQGLPWPWFESDPWNSIHFLGAYGRPLEPDASVYPWPWVTLDNKAVTL